MEEIHNDVWCRQYVKAEAAQTASQCRMSKLTENILSSYSLQDCSEKHCVNAKILYESLSGMTFFEKPNEESVPFGGPILIENRASLVKDLAQEGFFLASHWAKIDAPAQRFSRSTSECL